MSAEHTSLSNRSRKERSRHDPFARIPATSRATTPDHESSLLDVLKSALFALPISLLCGIVLLSGMAAIALAQPNPSSLITPLSFVVLGVSALCGGLICVRRCGHSPALCGVVFGLFFVLITWVLSFIPEAISHGATSGRSSSLLRVLLIRLGTVLLSCLGALVGARRTQKPMRHHKR